MPTQTDKPKRPPSRRPRKTARAKAVRRRPTASAFLSPVTPKLKPVKRTYVSAVGRRKSAIARVRFTPRATPSVSVNGQPLDTYFRGSFDQQLVLEPLTVTAHMLDGAFSIRVSGGGTHGQAEACRLGLARALVLGQGDLRTALKPVGLLRRDPRVKERKKYGLKRARRAPQWQKR